MDINEKFPDFLAHINDEIIRFARENGGDINDTLLNVSEGLGMLARTCDFSGYELSEGTNVK